MSTPDIYSLRQVQLLKKCEELVAVGSFVSQKSKIQALELPQFVQSENAAQIPQYRNDPFRLKYARRGRLNCNGRGGRRIFRRDVDACNYCNRKGHWFRDSAIITSKIYRRK